MGLSNLRRISELVDSVDKSFHVDTITDGVDSDSLGSRAKSHCTGTQWFSCRWSRGPLNIPRGGTQFEVINVYEYYRSVRSFLYANGVAGSLSNHLLWPNPRGSQLFLSHRWVVLNVKPKIPPETSRRWHHTSAYAGRPYDVMNV